MHVIYTGERVRLRPFEDAAEFMRVDDEIMAVPNEHWGPWWTPRPKQKREFEETGLLEPGGSCAFAVERLDTGEVAGVEYCGLRAPTRIYGFVGTFILERHWHRGFGIEAKQLAYCHLFENYPITQVWAGTVETHARAAKGLHLSGMRYEWRVKCNHFIHGKLYDLVRYSIRREEWLELPIRRIVRRGVA